MDIQDVINYINETPNNTNPAVLKGMVEAIVESSESGESGGGGGRSSLPTVTFTLTGEDNEGMPIFACDKTYNEAYQIHMRGESCAKMVIPNEREWYTTLVLTAGLGLRYAFYTYHTDTTLEFSDIYFNPDGGIGLAQSHYDMLTDDTPTE